MTELRLDGKTEDGNHLSLVDGDGNNYSVRISDTLRATVNQPRLTSVPAVDARNQFQSKRFNVNCVQVRALNRSLAMVRQR